MSSRGLTVPLGPHITPRILKYLEAGTYEEHEAKIITDQLEPADVVLEIGGGIGFISALCAKRISDARIHVYEANPLLQGPIEELYRLNEVAPNLTMCGLGPTSETRTFYVTEHFWESSFVRPKSGAEYAVPVEVREFDREVARYDPMPNFLILDIEGAEYELLSSISLASFTKILCEFHNDLFGVRRARLTASLKRRGFRRHKKVGSDDVWYFERQERGQHGA